MLQTKTDIYNITNKTLENIRIQSYYKKEPMKLNISMIYDKDIKIDEGSILSVKICGKEAFVGYIFSYKIENDIVTMTAYDKMRYLVSRDTFVYKDKTLSELIQYICMQFGIKTGSLYNTSYKIPYRIEENQIIMDIIYTAMDMTTKFDNKNYIFYDEYGKIALKSYDEMELPITIDCDGDIQKYVYESSVDKGTYNSVKVSIKNKKTKLIHIYTEEDKKNIEKWGTLRIFKRLPNDFSEAQIREYAKNMLNIHNNINKNINLEFVQKINEDMVYIRAGNIIEIKKGDINEKMLVKKCLHNIKKNESVVNITLRRI